MKILAIGAHPDDIEIGVGATLLKHRDNGDDVQVIVLTQGESGGQSPLMRRAEAEAAAASFGADITVFTLPDTQVQEKPAIDVIESVASQYGADVAYTHSVHDTHQDHRTAAYASRVALRQVPKLYAYRAPSVTGEFTPARFPDVSDHLELKHLLLSFHKSQAHRVYMQPENVEAVARYWGVSAGNCAYTEPLEVIHDRDCTAGTF